MLRNCARLAQVLVQARMIMTFEFVRGATAAAATRTTCPREYEAAADSGAASVGARAGLLLRDGRFDEAEACYALALRTAATAQDAPEGWTLEMQRQLDTIGRLRSRAEGAPRVLCHFCTSPAVCAAAHRSDICAHCLLSVWLRLSARARIWPPPAAGRPLPLDDRIRGL